MILFFCCNSESNKLEIDIQWGLDGNQINGQNKFASTFYLTNSGSVTLDDQNWVLYYNMTPRVLVQDSFTGQVTFSHVNGDLFVIKPDRIIFISEPCFLSFGKLDSFCSG